MMSKTTGSLIMSGAISSDPALTFRADKLTVDSRFAKIMEGLCWYPVTENPKCAI